MQATEPSVGDGRDPARDDRSLEDELLTYVRTCRRIPATIRGDDAEVGDTGALLPGFQQSETLGVAASIHDSQADATLVEKSQLCERLNQLQQYPQSAEALQVDSVKIIQAKPIKQDHEAAESGDGVKKRCNSGCAEDRELGDIFDTVGRYDDTENDEEEIHEGDNFHSVFALEDMPFLQKEDPDLAGIIRNLSTGDLPISDRLARKMLGWQISLHWMVVFFGIFCP